MEEIIDDEFGAEQLDLVIDDASHQLEPTRASFEMLFPRLRPGGLYVIEDWNGEGFGRAFGEALADPDSPAFAEFERRLREEPAAVELAISRMTRTRLTIELVLAQAESDEVISEVAVRHLLVRVRRGSGHLDPRTFRLSQLYTDHLGLLSGGLVPAS